MRYYGTCSVERIMMNPMDDLNSVHYIELEKAANGCMLLVTCCREDTWAYAFRLNNNSDYERIKYNIMNIMFECETMSELLEVLSDVFENGFEEMLIKDECDGNCDNCNCK